MRRIALRRERRYCKENITPEDSLSGERAAFLLAYIY